MVSGMKNISPVRFQDVNDKAVQLHHHTLTADILSGNHPGRPGGALYGMREGQRSLGADLDQGRLSNRESGLEVSCAGRIENHASPLPRSFHDGLRIT